MEKRIAVGLLLIGLIIAASISFQSLSDNKQEWSLTKEGLLQYSLSTPKFQLRPLEISNGSTLYEVKFTSRDTQIAGLLRKPTIGQDRSLPGIVLLPGATITKEREQGLAKYLCNLGYASITFDQRNLGAIDMQADLQMFLKGIEPTEHKMVYDALAAAEILRIQPDIDQKSIVYMGESNGGRSAIIAGALDAKCRGIVAISTSGYGVDAAIDSGSLGDHEEIRFLKSIDPEAYLYRIPPRRLVMIHSKNDPVIPYDYAYRTYINAIEPKELYTAKCAAHGYCTEMGAFLEKELFSMVS